MDRFEEQYKEELHKQEIHANHCTMKGFLWILAGFTFVWLLTITNVFIVDTLDLKCSLRSSKAMPCEGQLQ